MANDVLQLTDQIADLYRQVATHEEKVLRLIANSENGSGQSFAGLYGKYPGPPWSSDEDFQEAKLKYRLDPS